MTTMKNLMLINDAKLGFEVHGATCPDLKKKMSDLREKFTAATELEAREYAIDADMQELGYTLDDVRIMGCCHFETAKPAKPVKLAETGPVTVTYEKTCPVCETDKRSDEFYRGKRACKPCYREYAKAWRAARASA
jgi:hypothetical protein